MIFGESQGKDGPFLTFMLVLETVVLLVFCIEIFNVYLYGKKKMYAFINSRYIKLRVFLFLVKYLY